MFSLGKVTHTVSIFFSPDEVKPWQLLLPFDLVILLIMKSEMTKLTQCLYVTEREIGPKVIAVVGKHIF